MCSGAEHFNWNLWQGQTTDVPYLAERSHYTFRWWLDYSGGQMAELGAHRIDIAQMGHQFAACRDFRQGEVPGCGEWALGSYRF